MHELVRQPDACHPAIHLSAPWNAAGTRELHHAAGTQKNGVDITVVFEMRRHVLGDFLACEAQGRVHFHVPRSGVHPGSYDFSLCQFLQRKLGVEVVNQRLEFFGRRHVVLLERLQHTAKRGLRRSAVSLAKVGTERFHNLVRFGLRSLLLLHGNILICVGRPQGKTIELRLDKSQQHHLDHAHLLRVQPQLVTVLETVGVLVVAKGDYSLL
mmetsp:Transcript_24355/g.35680  ORF Transcript_24355/g.35680 Transcript_24355/m.35680 type:complete len:212 (-) Transcript_24355:658-1293(-)